MSLRILLVSDHYPPFIGGAHRQTHLLGQELTQRGHTVKVVTSWQPGLPSVQFDGQVEVHRIKEMRTLLPALVKGQEQRHHPPYADPVTVWGLRRLINRFQPDVVHAHGWFSYSSALALTGKRTPLLISTRDYGYGCATRTLLHNNAACNGPALGKCLQCASQFYGPTRGVLSTLGVLTSRLLLRRKVQGVHSVSRYVQNMVERDLLGFSGAQLEERGGRIVASVISSFLIQEQKTPDAAFLQALPTQPFILFVGGLQPRKGLNTLLEAYQQLRKAPPLVLIGYETPDTPKSFPAGVIVLRNAPHANVMAAWERAAFGVMPSLWPDPSPGVVREAMSKGKAVVGTAIGGASEMIQDGKTGFLVPPGDAALMASAMQQLIDDPALCRAFGRAAQASAEQFMASVSVPRFEQLYQRLIHGTTQNNLVSQPITVG